MTCEICKKPYITDETLNSDDKPHVCNVCGKGFSLKIQLKRHILSHEGDVPYICNTCEKHLEPTSYNLRLSQKGNFACETCGKSFPSKRLLLRHASEHTVENALECDQCGESFRNMTALKKHATTHKSKTTKEKTTKSYICIDCGKQFVKLKSFEKHQLTHNFKCNICDACFTSNKLLEKHKARDNCKSNVLNSGHSLDLNVNNNNNNSDEKKHVCNICNKSFTRKSALEGHMTSHFSDDHESPIDENDDSDIDRDFECNYKEKSKEEVKQKCLPKLKINRSFKCGICDVVCISKKSYDKHVTAHDKIPDPDPVPVSTAEDTKIYTCRICNETFNTKENYKKHKQLHDSKDKDGEQNVDKTKRTYTCQICKNVFCKKKHLRRHLKKHFNVNDPDETSSLSSEDILLGKRPKRSKTYACNFCGKLFAGETCWKKHEAKHLEEEEGGDTTTNKEKKTKKLPQNLICDFCQEDFSGRKQNFLRHKQSHTPEVCGICDARFVDRAALREHCRIHIGTEEGRRFLECSQKALDAKNGVQPPEPKVEYIYLVLR